MASHLQHYGDMKSLRLILVTYALCCLGVARAEEPDATFAAVRYRQTVLRFADQTELKGTLIAFDAQTVTLVQSETGRVLTLSRATVTTVLLQSGIPAAAPAKPRERHIGLQISTGPGNVLVDFDYGRFYGFAGMSIGYPLIFSGGRDTSSGYDLYVAGVLGAGMQWRLSPNSNWKFDLTATLTPTWWDGFSMGIGIAAGFHYTSPTGFTAGFKIPVFGVAPGCSPVTGDEDWSGSSTRGCGKVSSGGQLVANYFLQAGMNLPIVSIGYRF